MLAPVLLSLVVAFPAPDTPQIHLDVAVYLTTGAADRSVPPTDLAENDNGSGVGTLRDQVEVTQYRDRLRRLGLATDISGYNVQAAGEWVQVRGIVRDRPLPIPNTRGSVAVQFASRTFRLSIRPTALADGRIRLDAKACEDGGKQPAVRSECRGVDLARGRTLVLTGGVRHDDYVILVTPTLSGGPPHAPILAPMKAALREAEWRLRETWADLWNGTTLDAVSERLTPKPPSPGYLLHPPMYVPPGG